MCGLSGHAGRGPHARGPPVAHPWSRHMFVINASIINRFVNYQKLNQKRQSGQIYSFAHISGPGPINHGGVVLCDAFLRDPCVAVEAMWTL